jgi:hypothetical protein
MIKLNPKILNTGSRMKFYDTMSELVLSSIEKGMYAVITEIPRGRNLDIKRITSPDITTSESLLERYPLLVMSKIPTSYNLCGSSKFLAWKGNEDQDRKTNKILREIEYEMSVLETLGGSVIMELGNYRSRIHGLNASTQSLNNMSFTSKYKMSLINSLDVYDNIGITLKDLYYVYSRLDRYSQPKISISLNLIYLFVNGLYDIRKCEEIDRIFSDFDELFDDKFLLKSVILSDNTTSFDSKKYMPECIGNGIVWNCPDVLSHLVEVCQKRNISIITELEQDCIMLNEIINNIYVV